jgi:myo-inositol 2-dehydrogenase/D-chiro-inositol 1-dehydrogenase
LVPAFCEKPIALDLGATDEVIRHVERAGILVQIGFQRRFDDEFRAARDACTSGALGDVRLVRLATHDPAPPPDAYVAASGGIWKDLAIHDFDIGAWVLGSPITEVFAIGQAHGEVFARNHDVDAASATLRFAGGAVGALTATRNDGRGYDVRMELIGLRDSVMVGSPGYRDFIQRFEPAYRAEIDAFLEAVRDGSPSPCPVADARAALVAAVAADLSMREHRPVRVDEVAVTR